MKNELQTNSWVTALIIFDIQLPDMNGIEVVDQIHATLEQPR